MTAMRFQMGGGGGERGRHQTSLASLQGSKTKNMKMYTNLVNRNGVGHFFAQVFHVERYCHL